MLFLLFEFVVVAVVAATAAVAIPCNDCTVEFALLVVVVSLSFATSSSSSFSSSNSDPLRAVDKTLRPSFVAERSIKSAPTADAPSPDSRGCCCTRTSLSVASVVVAVATLVGDSILFDSSASIGFDGSGTVFVSLLFRLASDVVTSDDDNGGNVGLVSIYYTAIDNENHNVN